MGADKVRRLRLEGDCTIETAAEWKARILPWMALGGELSLDMEAVTAMDVTMLQLLLACGREAARTGATISVSSSEVAAEAARDAGLTTFPLTGVPG